MAKPDCQSPKKPFTERLFCQACLAAVAMITLLLTACQSAPEARLPREIWQGQSLLVAGFTAELGVPYEGGMLYSGFMIDAIDEKPLTVSLRRYDIKVLAPGPHTVSGRCYWRLRGVFPSEPDIDAPFVVELLAEPDTVYTVLSEIDEYKRECRVDLLMRRLP